MPAGSGPAGLQQCQSTTRACQAMTTRLDVQNADTNRTKKLHLQIFRQTSADLRSPEGFFVRHRKEPQTNCLTPNGRTQSATGGFSSELLLIVERTKGLKARASLFHSARRSNDPFAKFVGD
jgi:hypothetical protein